ncbi:hypothetical protein H8E88_23500 [candidate division KSB1 bacterium]|nr:hypothetical protein [candidate division KSB1 bacterium]
MHDLNPRAMHFVFFKSSNKKDKLTSSYVANTRGYVAFWGFFGGIRAYVLVII